MKIRDRKFRLDDDVVIHRSFNKECNDKSGKILSFINVDQHYYYDVKLDNGKYALGVLEDNLKKSDKR